MRRASRTCMLSALPVITFLCSAAAAQPAPIRSTELCSAAIIHDSRVKDDFERYVQQIRRRIFTHFSWPDQSDLKAAVTLGVDENGAVRNVALERSSGDQTFDAMVLSAIRNAAPFDVPSPDMLPRLKTVRVHFDASSEMPPLAEAESRVIGKWRLDTELRFRGYKNKTTFLFDFRPDRSVFIEHTSESNSSGTSFQMLCSAWRLDGEKIVIDDVYRTQVTPPELAKGSFDSSSQPITFRFSFVKRFVLFGEYKLRSENFETNLSRITP